MAIFKSSKNKENASLKKETMGTATIITKGTKIVGDIIGEDSVHVDGDIEGSITVNNIVVIGKSGNVNGDIEAQKVISSGNINGSVKCDDLEVMDSSTVKKRIDARKVVVRGKIYGDTLCDELNIEQNGYVENRVQAKSIIVSGSLIGEVACDLLSTKQTGFVKGSMFVSNISNEGGKVEGSIGQYKELLTKTEKSIEKESDAQLKGKS